MARYVQCAVDEARGVGREGGAGGASSVFITSGAWEKGSKRCGSGCVGKVEVEVGVGIDLFCVGRPYHTRTYWQWARQTVSGILQQFS